MPTPQEMIDQTFGAAAELDATLNAGVTQETSQEAGLNPSALESAMKAAKEGKAPEKTEVEAKVEAEATEEQVEEITEESAIAATEEPEAKPHRDRAAEKRIAKLTMERERLKGQLEAMRHQAMQGGEVQPMHAMDPGAPNPANYPEGERDVDFKVDLKLYQRDVKARQDQIKSKVMEAKAKHPDIDDLISDDLERNQSGIRTSNPTVERLLTESDNFAEVWHHLLANPDEAIRIASLDPVATAREFGRIEARLSAPKPAPAAKKAALPPPLAPVKTTKPTPKVKPELFGFSEY